MDDNANVMETEIKKVWTARIEYVFGGDGGRDIVGA